MTISLQSGRLPRTFHAASNPFFSYSILLEQLLLHGVAVISGHYDSDYRVDFTPNLISQEFSLADVDLQSSNFRSLDDFWAGVTHFAGRTFWYFDSMRLLGHDKLSSVVLAVRASYTNLMIEIENHFTSQTPVLPITDWQSQLSADGRVLDPAATRSAIYFHGLPPSILPDALPFILNLFPPDSTTAEREASWRDLTAEFETYCRQLDLLLPAEREHNADQAECFRVLSYDIHRVEKSHPAFKSADAIGNVWSERLMQAYCMYHPQSSYHQGMLDFLQPILLVFFQGWDWRVTAGSTPGLVKTFWCFDAFLKNTNQVVYLETVSDSSKVVVHRIRKLLKKVAPVIWVWLRLAGLAKLMWMHSDLALMYKRTFKDIWPYWLQIHCSPAPSRWLPCLAAAFLLVVFNSLLELPTCTLAVISEAFPRNLQKANVADVGKIALWLYHALPPEPPEEPTVAEDPPLEFFAPV
jgi:hypothetical protein